MNRTPSAPRSGPEHTSTIERLALVQCMGLDKDLESSFACDHACGGCIDDVCEMLKEMPIYDMALQDAVLHELGTPNPAVSKQWLREYVATWIKAIIQEPHIGYTNSKAGG